MFFRRSFLLAVPALLVPSVLAQDEPRRDLKAAALRSELAKRSSDLPVRSSVEMHYFENDARAEEPVAARVRLESISGKTLLLEEIDHMLREVHCEAGYLDLKFRPDHFLGARDAFDHHSDLFVITSHLGCNNEGERFPYRIVDKSYHDDDFSARFELGQASWKNDFKIEIGFAPDDRDNYVANRHSHLRRRQEGFLDTIDDILPFDFPTPSVSQAVTLSGDNQIAFPTGVDMDEIQPSIATADLGQNFDGLQLFPVAEGVLANLDPLPGIEIICSECRTFGQVVLQSGFFSSEPDPDFLDIITDGNVSIRADGVGARMAFDTTFGPELEAPLEIDLIQIPLTPLGIPGLANIGITFTPRIVIAATTSTNAAIKYGFDAVVPDGSTAVATFGDATDSTATGFDQASIEALPFNSNISTIAEVRFAVTFQPEISLGVIILDQLIGAAFFLNLPEVALTIAAVNGTDANCEPLGPEDTTTDLGPLVHIEPEVILAAGFVIGAGDLLQTEWTPLATTFALPTTCLSFVTPELSFTQLNAGVAPTGNATASGGHMPGATGATGDAPAATGHVGYYPNATTSPTAHYPISTGDTHNDTIGEDVYIAMGQAPATSADGVWLRISFVAAGMVLGGVFVL